MAASSLSLLSSVPCCGHSLRAALDSHSFQGVKWALGHGPVWLGRKRWGVRPFCRAPWASCRPSAAWPVNCLQLRALSPVWTLMVWVSSCSGLGLAVL